MNSNPTYEKIGSRIKYFRTQKKLSQETLAEMSNLSRTLISHVETGQAGLGLDSLISIANVLEVSSDDLLGDVLISPRNLLSIEADSILLDCTPEENSILVSNMKALKKKLREYVIRK